MINFKNKRFKTLLLIFDWHLHTRNFLNKIKLPHSELGDAIYDGDLTKYGVEWAKVKVQSIKENWKEVLILRGGEQMIY